MVKLSRMSELELAQEYANDALEQADKNYAAGDISFRTYLNHRDKVEEIEAEIKAEIKETNKK